MQKFALTVFFIAFSSLAGAAQNRTITANVAADHLQALHLNVKAGSIRIGASHDNAIHIKVTLKSNNQHGFLGLFHWSDSNANSRLSAVKLKRKRRGQKLMLSLNNASGLDHVESRWRIKMPARQHVAAKIDAGKLALTGIAGGVNLQMNAGKIDIKVPRGAINAEVNAGKINAVSATRDRGDIALQSDIGAARLAMPRTPKNEVNQRSGLGQSIRLPGHGRDHMKLKVHVGKVELTLKKSRR